MQRMKTEQQKLAEFEDADWIKEIRYDFRQEVERFKQRLQVAKRACKRPDVAAHLVCKLNTILHSIELLE